MADPPSAPSQITQGQSRKAWPWIVNAALAGVGAILCGALLYGLLFQAQSGLWTALLLLGLAVFLLVLLHNPDHRYERMTLFCLEAAFATLALPGIQLWLQARPLVDLFSFNFSGPSAAAGIALIVAGCWFAYLDFRWRSRHDRSPSANSGDRVLQATSLVAIGAKLGATTGAQSPAIVHGNVTYGAGGVSAAELDAIVEKHVREKVRAESERDDAHRRLQANELELAATNEALQRIAAEAQRGDRDAQAVIAKLRADGDLAAAQERLIREAENRKDDIVARVRDLGVLAHEIASIAIVRGDTSTARQWLEKLLAIHRDDYVAQGRLGDVLIAQGDLPGALRQYVSTKAHIMTALLAAPDDASLQRDLSVSHNKIGDVLVAQGKLEEALGAYRADMEIAERLARADASNSQWQRDLSVSHNKIGDVLKAQGKLEEALGAYRAAMEIRERLARADASNSEWQRDLAVSHVKLGSVVIQQDDLSTARREFEAALAIFERLVVLDPTNAIWAADLQRTRQILSLLPPAS